jgi:hypothetical protein
MSPGSRRIAKHDAPRVAEWAGIALVALAGWAALAWLQFAEPILYDGDSYVHVRAGQQLREHGVRPELPQAWFSTWRERYSDKDFLFHVLLAIGASEGADLVENGKRLVLLLDALLLALLAMGLVRFRVRYAGLWLLLFLVCHPWILMHVAKVRPHLLGMSFVLAELLALLGRRPFLLLGLSALHVWSHSSWVLVPALAGASFVACWLRSAPLPWRSVAWVAGGLVLGNVMHPYFPNNITLAFDQIGWVARSVWVEQPDVPREVFGTELLPMTWRGFLQTAPGWAPVLAGVAAAAAFARKRAFDVIGWTLLLTAAGLFFAATMTNRFMAFFLPVGVWTAGYFWTAVAAQSAAAQPGRRLRPGFVLATLFLLCCLAAGLRAGHVIRAHEEFARAPGIEITRNAIAFLDGAAVPEEHVYHDFWQPFSALYYYRPDGRYVVGLDPIFFYRFDPDRFASALALHRGEDVDAHAILAGEFSARWVFVEHSKFHSRFWNLLQKDPRIRLVYRDKWAGVFSVAPR